MADPIFPDNQYRYADFGRNGHVYITSGGGDTATSYYCFVATAEAVVTYTDDTNSVTHSSKTIPAGVYVFGDFSAITVASGTVIAYIDAS